MERISGPGAVNGSFVGGNSILGIDGTVLTAPWANSVQEELAGLVEAMGLTLDPQDRSQVLQAIVLLVARDTGGRLAFTAPSDLTAGDPLLVEDTFGVVLEDVATGNSGLLVLRGTFTLPKDTGSAWAAGERLYWDDGAGEVTTTAGGNRSIGVAAADALLAAATGSVLLSGPPNV